MASTKPRRKRYIKGRVYKVNDSILTGHYKPNRRVVVINNDYKNAYVKRITKLENDGRNAKRGVPIEKYPDIRKPSVVENKTFRKAKNGKPLNVEKMRKTSTRLNKWDRKKIGIK